MGIFDQSEERLERLVGGWARACSIVMGFAVLVTRAFCSTVAGWRGDRRGVLRWSLIYRVVIGCADGLVARSGGSAWTS